MDEGMIKLMKVQNQINIELMNKLIIIEEKIDSLIPKVEDVRKHKEEIYNYLSENYKPKKNKPTQSGRSM